MLLWLYPGQHKQYDGLGCWDDSDKVPDGDGAEVGATSSLAWILLVAMMKTARPGSNGRRGCSRSGWLQGHCWQSTPSRQNWEGNSRSQMN